MSKIYKQEKLTVFEQKDNWENEWMLFRKSCAALLFCWWPMFILKVVKTLKDYFLTQVSGFAGDMPILFYVFVPDAIQIWVQ